MKHARDDYNRIQDPAGLIPVDEPVFLLRGQDAFAAEAVETYADILEESGKGDPEIIKHARAQAAAMRSWPHRKLPDMPVQQS